VTADAIAGGCLCGAIRFSIAGAPLALSLCHCRTCPGALAQHRPSRGWLSIAAISLSYLASLAASFVPSRDSNILRKLWFAIDLPA